MVIMGVITISERCGGWTCYSIILIIPFTFRYAKTVMIFHSSLSFLIFFSTGLISGIVDAIAGGGGLISVSILLGMGVPPHIALGTNKAQGSVGTFISTLHYYRAGLIDFKIIYKGLSFGFIGAILGSVISQLISNNTLACIMPFMLLIILIYTLFAPKMGLEDKQPLLSDFYFYMIFGFALGFYDGFFGPGTGAFWLFCLCTVLGYNLTKACAYTKVFNFKSNVIAAACFAMGGNINYKIAIFMACGQLLGGKLGAYLTIRNGAKLIRPVFIFIVASTIISLYYTT